VRDLNLWPSTVRYHTIDSDADLPMQSPVSQPEKFDEWLVPILLN